MCKTLLQTLLAAFYAILACAALEGGGVMLINLRNGMMGGRRTPTSRDYVQDGLIAMWDGIENAGWGTHDANTTTWKNLGSLGDTADIFRSHVNWGPDSAIFERVTNRIEIFGSKTLPAAILGHTWSIEAVFKPNNSYYSNYSGVCGNHYNSTRSNRGIVVAQYQGGSCGIGSWAGNASYSSSLDQPSASSFFPVNTPTSLTLTASGLNGSFSLYKNGTFVKANNNIGDKCNITCAQPFLVGAAVGLTGQIYASDRYFSGDIYAVRLSSRALTASEIAANYTIDKERFNLPDTT